MGNKGHSERGFFGDIYHYDEHGKKIGRSSPGFLGGYTNYDAKGNKVGRSDPGLFGGYNHYDNKGHKTGHSSPGIFGSYSHYDNNNKKTGSSSPNMLGGYSHSTSEGCYIATCVYGDYDCAEVMILRKFRDEILRRNCFGRLFVKLYYAVSPTVVKMFGDKTFFRVFGKAVLDNIIEKISEKTIS